MIKILVVLSIMSGLFFLTLFIGECEALRNKHPRFTKWWRKHVVGDDVYGN